MKYKYFFIYYLNFRTLCALPSYDEYKLERVKTNIAYK